jgi:hypothetical protein
MAGCAVGPADETRGTPDLAGLQRGGDRYGFPSESRPPRKSVIPSKRINEDGTFDIAGDVGRGYVILSAFTEVALARKFKHPNGFNCHYTLGRGANNAGQKMLRGDIL